MKINAEPWQKCTIDLKSSNEISSGLSVAVLETNTVLYTMEVLNFSKFNKHLRMHYLSGVFYFVCLFFYSTGH